MRRTHLIKLRGERTQPDVARETGLSVRTISRAELGSGMALETARALARFYGVPLEFVLDSTVASPAEPVEVQQ